MAGDQPEDDTRWIGVIDADALRHGVPLGRSVGQRQVVLLRWHRRIHAFERACPHEGADLARGWCEAARIHCPRHRASFALDDGTASSGWAMRPLRRYAVRVSGGHVFVADHPEAPL